MPPSSMHHDTRNADTVMMKDQNSGPAYTSYAPPLSQPAVHPAPVQSGRPCRSHAHALAVRSRLTARQRDG